MIYFDLLSRHVLLAKQTNIYNSAIFLFMYFQKEFIIWYDLISFVSHIYYIYKIIYIYIFFFYVRFFGRRIYKADCSVIVASLSLSIFCADKFNSR